MPSFNVAALRRAMDCLYFVQVQISATIRQMMHTDIDKHTINAIAMPTVTRAPPSKD